MKSGRSLQDLAAELQRQADTRKDFIAPQGKLEAKVVEGEVVLDGINGDPFSINPYAFRQFADHLGIPQKYADRMRVEQPDLAAHNLNTWLKADPANMRMVRTLDGRVRGFLSSKFRPLDNYDLAEAILPTLIERGVQIMSAELTETRMYIKGILPDLSDDLPEGLAFGRGHDRVGTYGKDGKVVAALVISNSDVGAGTLRVEPSMFTTWCTNLAIMMQAAMKKYHVGRAFEADANLEVFRTETRIQDDKAFFMKVQDVTRAAFDKDVWAAAMAQLKAAVSTPIVSTELPKVVEVTVKQLALPEKTTGSILTALAKGGDLSKWGLSSAITQIANDADDYELATDLERAGGKVLALDGKAWDTISKAA